MGHQQPLRGSCACGRNQFFISRPDDFADLAEVFFDNSFNTRRSLAAPLTAWLRVPLQWFHSRTCSLYPDESHSSIRRVYTPITAPATKQCFCGYCGTSLTLWTEDPLSDADFMNVTLGSLIDEDLVDLEDMGLLPSDVASEVVSSIHHSSTSRETARATPGIPWYEEITRGSRLGRMARTRRGGGSSADRTSRVEWEVTEYVDANEDSESSGKRKIDEVCEGDGSEKSGYDAMTSKKSV